MCEMTEKEDKVVENKLLAMNEISKLRRVIAELEAENKKLREAVKELVCRLEWVNFSYEESRLVNGSIEQGRQALGI